MTKEDFKEIKEYLKENLKIKIIQGEDELRVLLYLEDDPLPFSSKGTYHPMHFGEQDG